MYYLAVVPKKRHVVGRHFQPEDASGFIVKLDRSGPKTVLEPQTFVAPSQVTVDLGVIAQGQRFAEETGYISNLHRQKGLPSQFLKQSIHSVGLLEEQI